MKTKFKLISTGFTHITVWDFGDGLVGIEDSCVFDIKELKAISYSNNYLRFIGDGVVLGEHHYKPSKPSIVIKNLKEYFGI